LDTGPIQEEKKYQESPCYMVFAKRKTILETQLCIVWEYIKTYNSFLSSSKVILHLWKFLDFLTLKKNKFKIIRNDLLESKTDNFSSREPNIIVFKI